MLRVTNKIIQISTLNPGDLYLWRLSTSQAQAIALGTLLTIMLQFIQVNSHEIKKSIVAQLLRLSYVLVWSMLGSKSWTASRRSSHSHFNLSSWK